MYSHYGGTNPSWFDCTVELPVHQELGTRDQANIVHLDAYEEMVWIGTQRGRLLSYLVNLEAGHAAYSRFNVGVSEERVLSILSKPEGIVSLTKSNVLFNQRGGVGHQLVSPKALDRMTVSGQLSAIEQFPHHNVQLAVGTSDGSRTLFYVDSLIGELTTFFDLPHSVTKIHCCSDNPLLVIGGTSGQLSMVEGRVPRVASTLQSVHPCEVTSISSSMNYIFTCGKRDGTRVAPGLGSPQSLVPDVFMKVYDIRNLKQPIPVSVPSGAIKVEVASHTSSVGGGVTLLILSNYGMWEQAELYPNSTQLRNVDQFKTECYQPHSPDLNPTVFDWSLRGDLTALLDSSGVVHFWGRSLSEVQEYPYRINPGTSLGNVMLPPRQPVMPSFPNVVYSGNRESALDQFCSTRVYSDTVRDGSWLNWVYHSTPEEEEYFSSGKSNPLRPPLPILPVVAANAKEWDRSILVSANVSGLPYGSIVGLARASLKHSEKSHHSSPFRPRFKQTGGGSSIGELELDDLLLDEDPATASQGPTKRWKYTQVDSSINHSLFPFSIYNKSGNRSGLENGQGSWDILNSILQCLYNLTPLKQALKTTHVCDSELCLSCELGFLFHSMDEARFSRAKVCQPVRISRVCKKLFGDSPKTDLPDLLNKILSRLRSEMKAFSPDHYEAEDLVMNQLFGNGQSELRFISGESSLASRVEGTVYDFRAAVLLVRTVAFEPTAELPQYFFVDQVSGQIEAECEGDPDFFKKYQLVSVLVNLGSPSLVTPRSAASAAVPASHNVALVSVFEDLTTNHHRQSVNSAPTRSRAHSLMLSPNPLAAVIPEQNVHAPESHILGSPSVIREETGSDSEDEEEWVLFNDFVVTSSSINEAIDFSQHGWKKPVLAMYVHKESLERVQGVPITSNGKNVGKSPITVASFLTDVNLAKSQGGSDTFAPLTQDEVEEILRGDFMVALDTEFISIGLAAIEIREDGSREVSKPGDMVVGRVSALRVKKDPNDPLDGVPFIDHYISMDESEIKDYVTRFSGIRPGDLDPRTSSHWLTSSKSIYLKLRFLVDCGCRFVGHGLHTDFRIINLYLPSGSLVDTVQLFHIPGQRFLSLKFLANRLLDKSIQGEVHCSIEDARTAMDLYRKFLRLKTEGTLEATIKILYESGRSLGWK